MSIKIEELQDVLLAAGVKDQALRTAILKEAQELEDAKKQEKEDNKDGPKAKNKHVFFVRKDELGNFSEAGFLAKVPSDSDNSTLLTRIQTAAARENDAKSGGGGKRGRKSKFGKIEKYSEFFAHSKRKFNKEQNVQPLKELVEVVILPTEEIKFD